MRKAKKFKIGGRSPLEGKVKIKKNAKEKHERDHPKSTEVQSKLG